MMGLSGFFARQKSVRPRIRILVNFTFRWYDYVMQVQLTKPELERFINDKVKSGDFDSASAVVEDALARMMLDDRALTADDVAAIREAEQRMDRGEFVDFDVFAQEMRKKYCGK